jgi:hypothetical protein
MIGKAAQVSRERAIYGCDSLSGGRFTVTPRRTLPDGIGAAFPLRDNHSRGAVACLAGDGA